MFLLGAKAMVENENNLISNERKTERLYFDYWLCQPYVVWAEY